MGSLFCETRASNPRVFPKLEGYVQLGGARLSLRVRVRVRVCLACGHVRVHVRVRMQLPAERQISESRRSGLLRLVRGNRQAAA